MTSHTALCLLMITTATLALGTTGCAGNCASGEGLTVHVLCEDGVEISEIDGHPAECVRAGYYVICTPEQETTGQLYDCDEMTGQCTQLCIPSCSSGLEDYCYEPCSFENVEVPKGVHCFSEGGNYWLVDPEEGGARACE